MRPAPGYHAAYEKYVQCSRRISGEKPLTPAEFYVEQLNRRYDAAESVLLRGMGRVRSHGAINP